MVYFRLDYNNRLVMHHIAAIPTLLLMMVLVWAELQRSITSSEFSYFNFLIFFVMFEVVCWREMSVAL